MKYSAKVALILIPLGSPVVVGGNNSALFTLDDGNGNILATQKIEYTDFPVQSVRIYVENNVALLPSEH